MYMYLNDIWVDLEVQGYGSKLVNKPFPCAQDHSIDQSFCWKHEGEGVISWHVSDFLFKIHFHNCYCSFDIDSI